jgi:flagellar protein FlbT
MTTLVLELRADDMMIINGAPLRVRSKTRVELNGKARFLFGKQIMGPHEADSPARRIYYAFQTAYIGDENERPIARVKARELCEEFSRYTTSRLAVEILNDALAAVDQDRCYDALKLIRRIIRHEDAVTGRVPVATHRGVAQ